VNLGGITKKKSEEAGNEKAADIKRALYRMGYRAR